MRGAFTKEDFDSELLQEFINLLRDKGLDFEANWYKGMKKADPGDGTANSLKLRHKGKIFFVQYNKNGMANPGILDENQRDTFISCLYQFNLFSIPNYHMAFFLATLFLLLQFFVVLPGALDRSEGLYQIAIGLNITLLAGLILHYIASSNPDNGILSITGYIVLFPPFALLSPGSLLLLPIIKQSMHKALHIRILRYSTTAANSQAAC